MSSLPFLHVGHDLLDHADHPKEVGLKHVLHLFNGDALQWTHQADTCIVDWSQEEENTIAHKKKRQTSNSVRHCEDAFLPTEDIHVSVLDSVDALFDRFIVADVQDSQRESFPIRITSSFHQLIFTLQITHCCYNWKQRETDLVSAPHYVDDSVCMKIKTARKKSPNFLMFVCQWGFFLYLAFDITGIDMIRLYCPT